MADNANVFNMSQLLVRSALTLSLMLPLSSFALHESAEQDFGSNSGTRSIVNGDEASGRERWVPSVVGLAVLEDDGTYSIYCTGTLLNDQSVLTAAHCLDFDSPKKLFITFGLRQNAKDMSVRKITKQIGHEEYDDKAPDEAKDIYDIAIVKFKGGLPAGYRPMPLIEDESVLRVGSEQLVAGYGVTDSKKQSHSGVLRYARVTLKNLNYSTTEALVDEDAVATCNGDSGGPAMTWIRGRWYVWGVISRGDDNCSDLGIYTRVRPLQDWIQSLL